MMKISSPVPYCLVLLLLACLSCQKDDDNFTILDIEVEKEFYIDLWENLGPDVSVPEIRFGTLRKQFCTNSSLDYEVKEQLQQTVLSIRNIIEPDNCVPDSAQISASEPLNFIEEGRYKLEINLRNEIKNEGALIVEADRYRLSMLTEHGIVIQHNELMRIPEKLVWGYIAFNSDGMTSVVDQLFADLQSVGKAANLQEGYYGYFEFRDNDGLQLPRPATQMSSIQPIYFSATASSTDIRNLIDQYRQTYSGELEIGLSTWTGEEW